MVCHKYHGGSSHKHKTRRHRTKTRNGKPRAKCRRSLRCGKGTRRQKHDRKCINRAPGQRGGNALGNAIVPGTIAALLAYFSGTKKRRHSQSKKSRR